MLSRFGKSLSRIVIGYALLFAHLSMLEAFVEDGDSGDQADTLTMSGQVVDSAGRPIEGISVRIPANKPNDKYEATTDADGNFLLTLPKGIKAYSLTCLATSPDGAQQGFFQPEAGAAELPATVKIELKPAREIPVEVIDESGNPISEAEVLAITGYRLFAQTRSDASGRATLQLPAGLTLNALAAVKSGAGLDYFLFQIPRTKLQTQNPAQLPQDFDSSVKFTLAGARTVTAKVTDTQGKPIEGVTVYPWYYMLPEKGGNLNFSGWGGMIQSTNADGVASFDFIPRNNEQQITFWTMGTDTYHGERVVFDPASFVDQVDITMETFVTARGKVVDREGRPVADSEIIAIGNGHKFDDFRTEGKSDEDGNVRLKLVPNHYYMFLARKGHDISPAVCLVVRDEAPAEEFVLSLGPGTRVFGTLTMGSQETPVPNQSISLYLEPSPGYYDLPDEQQLPNPTDSRRAISPHYVQWTKTDEQGRYEFWAASGKYYLIGPQQIKPPHFQIEDLETYELNLHTERPDTIAMKGRVVYDDQPDKPLAGATVYIYADGATANRYPQAPTDSEGWFECERPYTPCIAYVRNEEKTFAAITRIVLKQRFVEMRLLPTSSASGRLVSATSGESLSGETITYGIRVYSGEEENSSWMTLFGGSTTTATDGSFELTGLLPGFDYVVNVVTDRDSDGHPRAWRGIGHVEFQKPGPIDLGELALKPGFKPPTLGENIERWFASQLDPAMRIESKLRDARLGHQHLMVLISSQDHSFCRKFFEIRYDSPNDVRQKFYEATSNFELMAIQSERLRQTPGLPDAFATLGKSLPKDDSFTIALFSAEGQLLARVSQTDLTSEGELDLELMYAFLEVHAPDLPDAGELIEAAFAQAKREEKKVLLQVSGAFCGPCILLSRYLDKHRTLIDKDYIWVKVDRRYPHGMDMIEKYRSQEGGIPWFVILDPDRKPLITSNAEEGNIGYPASTEGRKHFERMLRETAVRLTSEEIDALIDDLGK
ncbi:MAG TPA: carboxypeptidase regulatory-like domain-containing protein [Planctomycetaceae bacterium]|nr:carboxypeptidase regulatory-like domain-containing protein [Planctomycetaceae bacterium]